MKIFYDKENKFFKEIAKKLNNAVTIIADDNSKHHFEFIRCNNEARINATSLDYIEEAVEFYHNDNYDIYKYYTKDNNYYQEFPKPFTFKLPINIIRPTKSFIILEEYEVIDENYDNLDIILPVFIYDDEYFLYDGHKRLKTHNIDKKMVDVYVRDFNLDYDFEELIYILKEQNYKNIDDVALIPLEEAKKFTE